MFLCFVLGCAEKDIFLTHSIGASKEKINGPSLCRYENVLSADHYVSADVLDLSARTRPSLPKLTSYNLHCTTFFIDGV